MKSSINKFAEFIKRRWVVITLLILSGITTLSLWPMETLPDVPGSDKTHHFIAYATLMFPVALRKPGNWILIFVLFVFYSGAIELIQPYVNRYGEWLDLAANTIGLIFGVLIAGLINSITNKRID